jgi:hypothetical protein
MEMRGGSQRRAWARSFDDTYHLKLPTADTPWVLFNELLGVMLAAVANLHPAPSALVDVTDVSLIDNCGNPVESGTHFGSRWLVDYGELPDHCADAPAMHDMLYTLLAFDLLIMNGDRKHRDLLSRIGSVVVTNDSIIVDHGNALTGANWTPGNLAKNHAALLDPIGGGVYNRLTAEVAARQAARRIADSIASKLSDVLDLLFQVQAEVQPGHPLSDEERCAVVAFLNARTTHLEDLAVRQMQKNLSAWNQCFAGAGNP